MLLHYFSGNDELTEFSSAKSNLGCKVLNAIALGKNGPKNDWNNSWNFSSLVPLTVHWPATVFSRGATFCSPIRARSKKSSVSSSTWPPMSQTEVQNSYRQRIKTRCLKFLCTGALPLSKEKIQLQIRRVQSWFIELLFICRSRFPKWLPYCTLCAFH